MIRSVIVLLMILNSSLLSASPVLQLKPFETDGCTMFTEGPASQPKLWAHCCFEHDLRYWFGGTAANVDFADLELKACVKEVAGENWAKLIYKGVRAGHSSPVKSKYSWSWGWVQPRELSELSEAEIAYIKEELQKLPLDSNFRQEFIQKYLP